jgi:DnaJ-class molecular chaperone
MTKGIFFFLLVFSYSSFLFSAEEEYPSDINQLTNKQALTILGLSTDKLKRADLQTEEMQKKINAAYKKLAKQYHPDKTGGDERVFKNISAAKERLTHLNTVRLHEEEEGLSFNAFDGLFGAGFGRSSHGPRSSHFTSDNFGFSPEFTWASDPLFEDMVGGRSSFFAHSSSTSSQESKQQKSSKQQRNDFNVASSKKIQIQVYFLV